MSETAKISWTEGWKHWSREKRIRILADHFEQYAKLLGDPGDPQAIHWDPAVRKLMAELEIPSRKPVAEMSDDELNAEIERCARNMMRIAAHFLWPRVC